jgi:predicted GIY-YIG superfamily endonuclease
MVSVIRVLPIILKRRLPLKLLAVSRFMKKEDAYRMEYRIKKLQRDKKLQALREG